LPSHSELWWAGAFRSPGAAFAIAGGCAVYALGGPTTEHDGDVFLREADVSTARDLLVTPQWGGEADDGGMRLPVTYLRTVLTMPAAGPGQAEDDAGKGTA
jgi:hypothetical protein